MQRSHEDMLRYQLKLPPDVELAAADLLLSEHNLSMLILLTYKHYRCPFS